MLQWIILICLASHAYGHGTPYVVSTQGEPWPKPQQVLQQTESFAMDLTTFQLVATDNTCELLQQAIDRYQGIIRASQQTNRGNWRIEKSSLASIESLAVRLTEICDTTPPHLYMEEQYELKICSDQYPDRAELISNSVWGIMRGLETFSQLMVTDYSTGGVTMNCTQILDFPRFSHRGVLVDTARHFIPLSVIYDNLELMAMNKFNVFHWHMVDFQSFPYQSDVYPDLSAKGSWADSQIYTADDIQAVIDFATNRGIRVVVEFDTPNHMLSWGYGQPGLLTECYSNGSPDGSYGPIDPSKEENFDFMRTLFTEITQRFPDSYVHLGGDEVDFGCWQSNPNITTLMESLGIAGDYKALENYYFQRLVDIVENLPTNNGYIVWEDVFNNGVNIANETVVHVWKFENQPSIFYPEIAKVTAAGYTALLSSCWYLNIISYGKDWYKYYDCDPQGFEGSDDQKRLAIGGEVAMWTEYVDRTNLISRMWPRAAAAGERLWSDATQTTSASAAEPRIEEHRCRLLRRGFPVEPFGPSHCEGVI